MSRSSRWSYMLLAVVVVLSAPAASSAQFGGLKKKVKDKIAGDPQPASTTTASSTSSNGADPNAKARKDAWDNPVAITSATLDDFVKAMKAENAERAKFMASAPPSSGFAKWNEYKTAKAKCASDQVKEDSAQARLNRQMMAEAQAGKADNIQKYTDSLTALGTAAQARMQRCNSLARPTFTQEDYNAAYAEDNREEAAGAAAAGISPFVYARLKERVIAYTLMPSSWKANGYTADELHAIDARKAEIKTLLGADFNTSGQRNPVGTG
jgi:hypothetical protein